MLSGFHPFRGANEKDLFGKISRGFFRIPEILDHDAKQLLQKILVLNPEKRPKAIELCRDRWLSTGRVGVNIG